MTATNEWRISAASAAPGWLPVPVPGSAGEAQTWIGGRAADLRAAWGERWEPVHDRLVPALLQAALERRRAEDVMMFQIWPTDAPLCIYVHVQAGWFAPGTRMPQPGDGILCETEGLGVGVQLPIIEEGPDVTALGAQFVFAAPDQSVSVVVDPTLPEILGTLMPQVQAFVQSVRLSRPDGSEFRADPPALLEADEADSWIDSLSGP